MARVPTSPIAVGVFVLYGYRLVNYLQYRSAAIDPIRAELPAPHPSLVALIVISGLALVAREFVERTADRRLDLPS